MTGPVFGITLAVRLDLLTAERGGRTLRSGLRPLCVFDKPGGGEVVVGLCELQLGDELEPGQSGEGHLSCDVGVSDLVRSLVGVGSRFKLAEGDTPIGSAEVGAIEP